MQIDFVLAGFSKCGTTSLHAILSDHPDICMPVTKDHVLSEFLDPDELGARYDRWYAHRKLQRTVGYTNVLLSGMNTRHAPAHLAGQFPDAKVILIARDPFDRIDSSFKEFHNSGANYGVACPFEIGAALRKLPQLIEDSEYWTQLANWRGYFPDKQLLVLFLEEMKAEPRRTVSRCFEFIGVDTSQAEMDRGHHLNRGSAKFFDTKRLRELRKSDVGEQLKALHVTVQNQFLPQLGLRESFGKNPVEWGEEEIAHVLGRLMEDTDRFLEWCGRTADIWPRFKAARMRRAES